MAASKKIDEIIQKVEAITVEPEQKSMIAAQPVMDKFVGDICWHPGSVMYCCPPGHTQFSYTGVSDQGAAACKAVKLQEKKECKQSQPQQQAKQKQESKKKNANPKKTTPNTSNQSDISKVSLIVGKIVKVDIHPDAEKLYVECIDVGEDQPRTIVSGLVGFVPIETMMGADVIVVSNLKAVKMRGILSNGMVLAASNTDHTKIELVTPPTGSKPGERLVLADNSIVDAAIPEINASKKNNAWLNVKPDLTTDASGIAMYKKIPLITSCGQCMAKTITNGQLS